MVLKRLTIEGFRSLAKKVDVFIEPRVTIILGANDQGKSNLLESLLFLNSDQQFDPERDLSWDRSSETDTLPFIQFEFELTEPEREGLVDLENEHRQRRFRISRNNAAEKEGAPAEPDAEEHPPAVLTDGPKSVKLTRRGLASAVPAVSYDGFSSDAISEAVIQLLPRVELIKPLEKIQDRALVTAMHDQSNEFMKGIFWYAGIEPLKADALFAQSDESAMTLKNASQMLNTTLRESWSQGGNLKFLLMHDSANDAIELRIDDPSIKKRFARASRRSAGFTHYFALKSILYARQKENPAKSYIWLFDEPGIYLHPSGQHDLIHELEALGQHNQVLYSTHSLFMINKTFPTRHRLVIKDATGTLVMGKPYAGRWKAALSALGVSMFGTILFANHVLFSEGDADPTYIQAALQRLIALDKIDIDLNSFTVIPTGTSRNTDSLIRQIVESVPKPHLAVLVDGDQGGNDRIADIKPLLKAHDIASHVLADGTTIEDHIPLGYDLFPKAFINYLEKLLIDRKTPADKRTQMLADIKASFAEQYGKKRVTDGVIFWAEEASERIAGIKKPSKIGIAREYVNLLEDVADAQLTDDAINRSVALASWIKEHLKVPNITEVSQQILASEEE